MLRRAMVGAFSLAIPTIPTVVMAGDAQPAAQTSRVQVTANAAQPKPAPLANPRALGGFVFQPPTTLESPFITNHVRIETGAGLLMQNAVKPEIATPGAPATYDLRLGALQQRVNVGVALTPDLSLGFDGGVMGYAGTNAQSALQVGSGVGVEARPALKIALVNDQDAGFAMSVRAYGTAMRAMGVRPAATDKRVVTTQQTSQTSKPRAVGAAAGSNVDVSALGGGVSLSAAKNIGRFVGVQMELGGEVSRVMSGHATQTRASAYPHTVYAGTAASVDLSPIAPVGAMVEYRIDHSMISTDSTSNAAASMGDVARANMHRVSAGVYYTARQNLVLGAVGTYGLAQGHVPGPSATSGQAQFAGGRFTVGYFF
ncbi:hypothetical protein [Polyangium spumosum]|uniref:Outer membrane beta-barrel protein n=1 Tax=Polyangium spumosum TaxID=889282 RepID=A0A6N7PFX6_9BACT|nr:hypothetical protein [Polyangium spumosum]MRG90899.1 hypothetical protein [Polyangium spumosum]